MHLKEIQVVAEQGTEFGVLPHVEDGVITIICRRKGESWPYGMEPLPESINAILPPGRRFCVEGDIESTHNPSIMPESEIIFKP